MWLKLIGFFNYPFAAIEEALANAVYHKSYEKNEPIEVQIWPDKIEILSYPGPIPPVTKKSLLEHPRDSASSPESTVIGVLGIS